MELSKSWFEYYVKMANLVSSKSKDPKGKVGAVIVGPDMEVRSTGFNGAPRGVIECFVKPEKLLITEHAERNAIYNAARVGVPLAGCAMVVQRHPCADCARAIIQVGITDLYTPTFEQLSTNWQASSEAAKAMLRQAGVRIHYFKEVPNA